MNKQTDADKAEEYDVIVKSNELTGKIDQEMFSIHKYVRDLYATKFPELSDLVPHPYEYAQVVKAIGNKHDVSGIDLGEFVPQNVQLTITVTATTTAGKPLPPEVLKQVLEGCEAIIDLLNAKKGIYTYVESRMNLIAPNLTAIIGPEIAARIMGIAGGLKELSEMPSCNMQVLGVKRNILGGFASTVANMHQGLLGQTDIMLSTPSDLKQRAIRLLAAKCALAARIDSYMTTAQSDSSEGVRLREVIVKKIEKWQEPPPPKAKKALPVPEDKPRRRRGGKRYRKQRERSKITELMKQKNRMVFGKQQAVNEYTGEEFGMIGVSGTGSLRAHVEDNQKLKKRLARKTKAQLRRIIPGASTRKVSGTQSSFAMTPVQGIELVNKNNRAERLRQANQKYFSANATFLMVGNDKKD
eukprot:jgi/Bigna1/55697/estExt_Genewise1Plus.C_670093